MENLQVQRKKMCLANIESSLTLEEMEIIMAGSGGARLAGCASYGLAAGIAAGFNPFVGGLTTLGCFLLT